MVRLTHFSVRYTINAQPKESMREQKRADYKKENASVSHTVLRHEKMYTVRSCGTTSSNDQTEEKNVFRLGIMGEHRITNRRNNQQHQENLPLLQKSKE